MNLKQMFLLAFPVVIFSCCDKDDDVDSTPPQIQNVKINGENVSTNVTVQSGSTMDLSATFSDDQGLGSAKFNIHDDFDTHNHKISAVVFGYDTTFTLEGQTWTDTASINIPSEATGGPYHLTIHLLDNSGNEAVPAVIGFNIQSGSEPAISITSPDLDGEFHQGDTLFLDGTITDPDGLAEVQIIVEDHENEVEIYNHDFEFTSTTNTWDIGDAVESTGSYIILNFPGDHAEIRIIATDTEGHLSEFEHELHVH